MAAKRFEVTNYLATIPKIISVWRRDGKEEKERKWRKKKNLLSGDQFYSVQR